MATERITGIVISTIKHNDTRNVVTLFTRERGRITFLSASGNGRKGRARNARMMPLSVIEANVNFNPARELQLLGSVNMLKVRNEIYFHPVKSAVTIFLSEFLNRYLRNSPQDALTFDYIVSAFDLFDRMKKGISNFHILFLLNFLDIAGISPDLSDLQKGDWFDMRRGEAVAEKPLHGDLLSPAETALLPLIFRMKPSNLQKFRFSGTDRKRILELLLRYYSVHFPGMANLRSIDILSEIFA